ncbi:CobW family GTP-binding protein [Saliphagus infecundisoli]|uniref:CobW family GTP-binding protein n=1 Tax=Saliphagus infecundisoli TaxID=1849069 RepID=A0ABD5QB60_9EURY|nr:GTP-binding protein [Saliphagus infecundisoli]
MSDSIPVTVVSGNLGAGKTTLLNHLLETADRRLAVLVNDMGEVNVDASLLERRLPSEGIAELSNGCICCELRDDLATAVRGLADGYEFDHLVVESSGISEPAPVARLFTAGDAAARFEVASLVTVVDSAVLAETLSGETLERETPPDATDRPLADLLIEQIEVSNLVLLNKCDLLEDSELEHLEAIVFGLQPDAAVVRTTYSEIDPDRLFAARFDPDALGELAGWQRALEGGGGHGGHADHDPGGHADHASHDHRSPETVYGVESHVLRRRRPLDPARFADFLRDLEVVRAKGVCWLAGRDELAIYASLAGRSVSAVGEGPWIASLPRSRRELYRENHPDLPWDDDYGDRRTELVCLGTDLDGAALEDAIDACLLEDGESAGGEDPFPTEQGERAVLRA